MNRLIDISRIVFLILTVLVCVPAIAAFINPPEELTIAIVWIVLAVSCLGVITTWKKQ